VGERGRVAPARAYGTASGLFLLVLGVLSLIVDDVSLGAVGPHPPRLLVWSVTGWTTMLWIAMGSLAVAATAARRYARFAAAVFGVVAVWGFLDGHAVAGVLSGSPANDVTHAVLAGAGLLCALPHRVSGPTRPRPASRASGKRTV
jgi:hypothetical protein